jgi:16S rRNA A1518/A1519 N6-dimethyltransferase RsmA/KsgA/DIM1 with predicted DNA glycosylase/AP lyase activity
MIQASNFCPMPKILGSLVSVPQRRNERSKTNQKTLERLRPIARVAFAYPNAR